MSQHDELKRLAEACGDLNWRAIQENWCEWAIRDDHAYIATMRTKSAKHAGPCPDREAKAKFLCAVTPAAIKALIAENEALRKDAERLHKVSAELRQWASCNHLHHEPHEQHADDVHCKVLDRIDAAIGKGERS